MDNGIRLNGSVWSLRRCVRIVDRSTVVLLVRSITGSSIMRYVIGSNKNYMFHRILKYTIKFVWCISKFFFFLLCGTNTTIYFFDKSLQLDYIILKQNPIVFKNSIFTSLIIDNFRRILAAREKWLRR